MIGLHRVTGPVLTTSLVLLGCGYLSDTLAYTFVDSFALAVVSAIVGLVLSTCALRLGVATRRASCIGTLVPCLLFQPYLCEFLEHNSLVAYAVDLLAPLMLGSLLVFEVARRLHLTPELEQAAD